MGHESHTTRVRVCAAFGFSQRPSRSADAQETVYSTVNTNVTACGVMRDVARRRSRTARARSAGCGARCCSTRGYLAVTSRLRRRPGLTRHARHLYYRRALLLDARCADALEFVVARRLLSAADEVVWRASRTAVSHILPALSFLNMTLPPAHGRTRRKSAVVAFERAARS